MSQKNAGVEFIQEGVRGTGKPQGSDNIVISHGNNQADEKVGRRGQD